MQKQTVLVTGGAGYVGSALIPKLLRAGHQVVVLDLYIYGRDLYADLRGNPDLVQIVGDIRDVETVRKAVEGVDSVIHLACISNDPSYDLKPDLGKSINHDAFLPLVKAAKAAGVSRFIYASSSSVYGIKEEAEVTEDLPLEPLTDYSKFKVICEEILEAERAPGFACLTIRPSTVCGYAPRLRLDLTVNILTNHAINNRQILVFGGEQKRPNIHIEDMTNLYCDMLLCTAEKIDGKIYNAGYQNLSIMNIAETVRNTIDPDIPIKVEPTNDLRSYHVSAEKISRELGFVAKYSIGDAVLGLKQAFEAGKIPNSFEDSRYFNVKLMNEIDLI